MRYLRTLQAQILLWTILPLILILVTVSFVSITLHQNSMRSMVAERDAQLALQVAARLDDTLHERTRDLQTILATTGRSGQVQQALLDVAIPVENFDQGLVLYDAAHVPLNDISPGLATQAGEIGSMLQAAQAHAGQPIYRLVSQAGKPLLLLMALKDKETDRAVVGAISEQGLNLPVLFEQVAGDSPAQMYLVGPDGRVVYHNDRREIGRNVSLHAGVAQALRGEAAATFADVPGGDEHMVGYAPVAVAAWALIVEEPWTRVIAPALQYTLWAPVLVLTTAVASLAALYFGLQYVVRPLQILGRSASRLAWGDFQAIDMPVGGIDEVIDLQRTLQEMAAQIHRYQKGMQEYIAALTQAQEEERVRLARELHDEIVQNLIALGQRVKILQLDWHVDHKNQPDTAEGTIAARLSELSDLIGQCLKDVRGVIRDLRPIYLEELGLVPALEMLASSISNGVTQATFEIKGDDRRLLPETELAVYRIAQAAVSNAVRHGRPKAIALRLEFNHEGVLVTAEDDGAGFTPPEHPSDLAVLGHFGLVGMYERAVRLGGHFSIRSAPGQGTKVAAFLPDLSA